jgi:hypothetical protein
MAQVSWRDRKFLHGNCEFVHGEGISSRAAESWVRCESVGPGRDFSVLAGLPGSETQAVNFIDEDLHAAEYFRSLLQARGLILMLRQHVEQMRQQLQLLRGSRHEINFTSSTG